jgi:hypothetical protein
MEIDMAEPAAPETDPSYFMITGFPKSGNKWFHRMIWQFESIGGYHRDLAKGLPLLARTYLEHQELLDLLDREGVPVEDFVKLVLNPDADVHLSLTPSGREALRPHLTRLAAEATKIAKVNIPPARFEHVLEDPSAERRASDIQHAVARARDLLERSRRLARLARSHVRGERIPVELPAAGGPVPEMPSRGGRSFGTAGMHTPVRWLQALLPSFRILCIIRDPRDVVVSYFYHFMATLYPGFARELVDYDERSGAIEMNPAWKGAFAERFIRRLRKYYTGAPLEPSHVLVVRYEDLLVNAADEMARVLAFLGCRERRPRIDAVVEVCSFEAKTGGREEQRNSMTRKGQAGDWRNYFDRELLEQLGRPFVDLVRDLGYEQDERGVKTVPASAARAFEFSRFRIKRSTCRAFVKYWEQSPELQTRYPDPWHFDLEDSYYGWLCQCPHAEVQEWLRLARRLQDLWQVDIEEAVEV